MKQIRPVTTKEHIVNIYNKIELLETNHIFHLQQQIKTLNKILYGIGFMVATQFIAWVLKTLG
tara:strand:+ start:772 stop:960 length:189 start_codon:yes stop_codon:yes gene_type:complete